MGIDNIVEEYHTSDSVWSAFKADSHKKFLDQFLVIGKFHSNVPEQIVKDYKIVERLICYSYYHYPLIDEAFSKATRIFEGAIKLRLDQIGIPKSKEFESLKVLIEKFEPYTSTSLIREWDRAREIRNLFAHKEAGTLMGITIIRGFYQMVNILNNIFLDKSLLDHNETKFESLKAESKHLKKGLYKLNLNDKVYLIWSIIPHSYFETKTEAKSSWIFHPVLTYFPQSIEELNFSKPICLNLSNIKILKNGIEATIIDNNEPVKAISTDDQRNKDLLETHNKLFTTSANEVKQVYSLQLESELYFEAVKFLYNYCWK